MTQGAQRAQRAQGETGAALSSLPPYMIKICVPCYSDSCDEHKVSLIETEKAGINFEYQICQSSTPAQARNLLISGSEKTTRKQTLTDKFTHYLFVDADVAWQPEHILSLLLRKLNIVSAAYVSRTMSGCYQAGKWEHTFGNPGEKLVNRTSTGLNRVDWVGAGFLLCTREALERMEHPWFRHRVIEVDEDVPGGLVRRHAFEINEDCGFCVNATRSGVRIFLDCDTIVRHVTEFDIPQLRLTPLAKHFAITKNGGGPGYVQPAAAQMPPGVSGMSG